jgi:hypothetical protein
MNEHDVMALKAEAWDRLLASTDDVTTALMDTWRWLRAALARLDVMEDLS